MERIHLVYGYTVKGRVSRWRSPWYRVAGLFLILWIGVAIAMIIGRTAYIREHDNACIIGLKLYATVPMLVTDVIVNVYLTVRRLDWTTIPSLTQRDRRLPLSCRSGAASSRVRERLPSTRPFRPSPP